MQWHSCTYLVLMPLSAFLFNNIPPVIIIASLLPSPHLPFHPVLSSTSSLPSTRTPFLRPPMPSHSSLRTYPSSLCPHSLLLPSPPHPLSSSPFLLPFPPPYLPSSSPASASLPQAR